MAYIEGKVVDSGDDYVVVAVGGLGFRVFVPPSQAGEIGVGVQVKLHIHMAVREDSIALFGLQTEEELAVFRQLISVTGVGPRLALAILSTWRPDQLREILAREDVPSLTSVPGVGRKTAQRLLLELKDKIQVPAAAGDPAPGFLAEAEAALLALGFRSAEARPVLRALSREYTSTETLVRAALARLAGGEK